MGVSFGFVMSEGKAVPYSATVTTTHDQKLVDGNSIHTVTTSHQARDASGKTRSDHQAGCYVDDDGKLQPMINVSVIDRANRTTYSWSVGGENEKVARVRHQPPPIVRPPLSPEAQQKRQAAMRQQSTQNAFHTESLGTKVIAGVLCLGSKTTQTIPAGEMGNELAIEQTTENWSSRDLGVSVLTISESPLNGKTTTEVTELSQAEPDASLFMPPSGYKLEEQVTVTQPVSAAELH